MRPPGSGLRTANLRWRLTATLLAAVALGSCGGDSSSAPSGPTRSFLMGFSAIPPRPDPDIVVPGIDRWDDRADAAIMHVSPRWDALLDGIPAADVVEALELPLAALYRARGMELVFVVDPTNGLDRSADAPELVARGRSITEPAIQDLYREWAGEVAAQLPPDWLGLVAETNLIRAAAPAPVYQALVTMANAAAAEIDAAGIDTRLFVSVQVEVAWGRPAGPYAGIAQDLADFPFVEALGLSSYPYLSGFSDPEDIPLEYYGRVGQGTSLPLLVVEGGWRSKPVGAVALSPEMQRRYIERQAELLEEAGARAVFQRTFFDLDLAAIPELPGSALSLFANLGLADVDMNPKPALEPWDDVFSRPYRP
ncbi:MAG: hypothetical protein ACREMH_04035 [Gemmatimonadales bacterium]